MATATGSIDQIVEAMSARSVSLEQILETFFKRINHVNAEVHALIEVFPFSATEIDWTRTRLKARTQERREQPLLGVPIAVNCDIPTVAGRTTTGSLALNFRSRADAPIVERLTDAGAIIIGKANITEWGNNRDRTAGHGWSALGGQTLGVHHVDQDPSGSSSGAAVAVALGLCVAAVGVETSGGMILPAERNGIVGIRPTKGLVSPELVLTSRHFGTPGVLARTVKDAAIVLSTIADDDTEDGKHKFAIACDAGALQGMRIGVPTGYLNLCLNHDTKPLDQSIKERFARALGTMKNQGATIFEDVELIGLTFEDEIKEARSLARLIRICDYREEVEDFIKACGVQPEVGEFPELVNITRNDFVEEHTTRGAEWLKLAESGPRLRNQLKYEGNVQKVQHLGTEGGAAGALERYGLDAIVMPSMISSAIASYGGLPVVTVPQGVYPPGTEVKTRRSGHRDLVWQGPGIPFGISFIGAAGSDHDLIGMAYAYEQRVQGHRHLSVLPQFFAPREL